MKKRNQARAHVHATKEYINRVFKLAHTHTKKSYNARSSHFDVERLLIAWRNSCLNTTSRALHEKLKKTNHASIAYEHCFHSAFSLTEKRLEIITKRGAFVAYTQTKWTNKSEHISHGHFRVAIKIEMLARHSIFGMHKWFYACTWNWKETHTQNNFVWNEKSVALIAISMQNELFNASARNNDMARKTAEFRWIETDKAEFNNAKINEFFLSKSHNHTKWVHSNAISVGIFMDHWKSPKNYLKRNFNNSSICHKNVS